MVALNLTFLHESLSSTSILFVCNTDYRAYPVGVQLLSQVRPFGSYLKKDDLGLVSTTQLQRADQVIINQTPNEYSATVRAAPAVTPAAPRIVCRTALAMASGNTSNANDEKMPLDRSVVSFDLARPGGKCSSVVTKVVLSRIAMAKMSDTSKCGSEDISLSLGLARVGATSLTAGPASGG